MKNSNIIISVIIVLCIAGGVTAYTMTNPDGNIFSLPGYTPSDSGDTGDVNTGNDGTNNGTTATNSNSGNNNKGSGSSGSGSPSSGGSGKTNSGSGGNNNHGGMSASQAKAIIDGAIGEPGAYSGTPYWDSGMQMWVAKIYDADGNVVDGIGVDANGRTNRV